jgi:pyridoxal phosphate enzyme (YggS family)
MTDPEPTARDQRFADVAARVTSLRRRLEDAGGSSVRVVAVTKGFGVEEIEAAVAAGVDDIGENYAQEYRAKREALATDGSPTGGAGIATWHFIGQLQRNKVRLLSGLVDVWQTLDRPALAREIAKCDPGATVFVQVNVSGEQAKGGCEPDDLVSLTALGRDLGLRVDGVMAVGPTGPPSSAFEPFRRLVDQADELGLAQRSLGMSADLEVAVSAGATMVRVGRDLFGSRPSAQDQ